MKFSCFTLNNLALTGSIVHKGLHILLTSTASLAFVASSVQAQNDDRIASDAIPPICGTMVEVEVDGEMSLRPITENCNNPEQDSRKSGSSSVPGIVIGGILLVGLASSGGGDSEPPPPATPPLEDGGRDDGGNLPVTPNPIPENIIPDDWNDLVTDRYDRGYFASLAPRIAFGSNEAALKINLSAAFTHVDEFNASLFSIGFGLRMDSFGIGHEVTGIAHVDPVMALVAQNSGTGFSMQVPSGKATLSMASMTTPDASAVSLGASLPFGEGHVMTVSVGHAKEDNSILGASVQGAFAGLKSETFYGRVQTDFAFGEKVTLNGSATGGQTSFNGIGLLRNGSVDTLAMSLGLTLVDTFKRGDKLSLALAQPLAVSGGEITLRSGTGISPAVQNLRTNRINFTETTIPLAKANRDPELHLGYMRGFDAGWADADFAFGGVARLDGGTTVMAAQAKLVFRF